MSHTDVYENRPREFLPTFRYSLETKYGFVDVTPTDAHHVHVQVSGLPVNNVPYNLSVHLYEPASRSTWSLWTTKDSHSFYGSRADGKWKQGVTPSARDKIISEFSLRVTRWAHTDEGKKALSAARDADQNNEILKIERQVADLEAQLEERRTALARAKGEL